MHSLVTPADSAPRGIAWKAREGVLTESPWVRLVGALAKVRREGAGFVETVLLEPHFMSTLQAALPSLGWTQLQLANELPC